MTTCVVAIHQAVNQVAPSTSIEREQYSKQKLKLAFPSDSNAMDNQPSLFEMSHIEVFTLTCYPSSSEKILPPVSTALPAHWSEFQFGPVSPLSLPRLICETLPVSAILSAFFAAISS